MTPTSQSNQRAADARLSRLPVVAQLVKAGISERAIGRQLGLSHTTIREDVSILRQQWREDAQQNAAFAFEVDLARIDDMLVALTPGVRQGNPKSIDLCIKLLRRRADMFGYDAARKVDIRVDAQIISTMAEVVRAYIPDPETLAAFQDELMSRAAQLTG